MTKKAVFISPSNTVRSLTSLGRIPLISHQISIFSQLEEIIVITGKDAKLLEDYLLCAHPDKKIIVIRASTDLGNIFGTSQELLKLRNQLTTPFFIVFGNYFLNTSSLNEDRNWTSEPIIHVFDHLSFWNAIKQKKSLDTVKANYEDIAIDYLNLSEPDKLLQARNYLKNDNDQEFDFSKPEEAIYFPENMVVKYFQDEKIVKARVERIKFLNGLTPSLDRVGANYYSYKKVPGKTMYECLSPGLTNRFLWWCSSHLWDTQKPLLADGQTVDFFQACVKFYKNKTNERIHNYWNTVSHKDIQTQVNGEQTPTLNELIELVDWDYLCHGTPVRFHGDLQFDNVLFVPNGSSEFILLDWRESFAGLVEYGDIYYDLAKLYGGLIIPYSSIKKNKFAFSQADSSVEISLQPPPYLHQARDEFREFIKARKYDKTKIQLLTGIIFINMSPLHHEPFNFFLHHLGKLMLTKSLYV